MAAPRKFDWDEAARLRATGLSYREIGRRLGVTGKAIALALDPRQRVANIARQGTWQRAGACPDCGAPSTRHRKAEPRRCRTCYAKAQAKVRGGEAYCPGCSTWKPLAYFSSSNSRPARGVRHICRACDTARKRAYRSRPGVKERENQQAREARTAIPSRAVA